MGWLTYLPKKWPTRGMETQQKREEPKEKGGKIVENYNSWCKQIIQ